jgi:hypothetical protein
MPLQHLQSPGLRFIQVFVRLYVDTKTIWTIPIVLILATGLPTALAAHTHGHTQTYSPAYLYGLRSVTHVGKL